MRIGIDIRKIGKNSTGDETYTYNLIKELTGLKKSKRHKFFLLTDVNEEEAKKSLSSPLPANFKVIKITPTQKLFWTFYSLPKFLKANPLDILHVQYITPFYLKKPKIITTIHDVSFKANPKWVSFKDRTLLNFLIPKSIRKASAVITVSEFSKSEIYKYYSYPKEKIFVTYPWITIKNISTQKAKSETSKILNGDFSFILHISSLQPRKNVPLILEAFNKLKDKNLKLVIVGKRGGYNYDKKIDKVIKEENISDRVIFTGYIPTKSLPVLYKSSVCFTLLSKYEGFGIPIIEAMAYGTPVVASNLKVFQEVGGEGLTTIDINKDETVQIDKLTELLEKVVSDKKFRDQKIKLGYKRKDFSNWKKMAEKTLEVYEKVGK